MIVGNTVSGAYQSPYPTNLSLLGLATALSTQLMWTDVTPFVIPYPWNPPVFFDLPDNFAYWPLTATRFEQAKPVRRLIDEFRCLRENWDGYGAAAICEQVCNNAQRFIDIIDASPVGLPIPNVAPMPTGTISFEWETEHAEAYLEIGTTRFSGFIKPNRQEPTFFEGHVGYLDQQIVSDLQRGIYGPAMYSAPITEIHIRAPGHERLAA